MQEPDSVDSLAPVAVVLPDVAAGAHPAPTSAHGVKSDGPIVLSFDEAVKLLPEGDTIHTFRNPRGGMMLGADWGRATVLVAMRATSTIQVTGPMAQAMGHGLAIDNDGLLFIEAATYKEQDAGLYSTVPPVGLPLAKAAGPNEQNGSAA